MNLRSSYDNLTVGETILLASKDMAAQRVDYVGMGGWMWIVRSWSDRGKKNLLIGGEFDMKND